MHASTARRAAARTITFANGAQIPRLGFGTWKAQKGQVGDAVSHALKSGYTHLDLAWAYRNEDEIGEALKKSGVSRQSLWLTSKLWNSFHDPSNVEKGLDASLKDLGTDYLDLYLVHWPVAFANPEGKQVPRVLDEKTGKPLEQVELSRNILPTWKKLEEQVQKGKIRHLGISNFNIRRTQEMLNNSEIKIKPVTNQVEVNLGVHNDELLQYSEAVGIKLEAYSPLGSNDNIKQFLANAVVKQVAKKNNLTPAQVLLAWPMARGIITLAKSVTPSRIEENLKAMEIDLPSEDVEALLAESRNFYKNGKPFRTVDPYEGWGVKDDIYEDGKDQARLADALASASKPSARFGGASAGKRAYHTSAFSGRRSFSTSVNRRAAAELEPPTAEEAPAIGESPLLRNSARQAARTPGIKFADGEEGIERETRKMNMYTVGTNCRVQNVGRAGYSRGYATVAGSSQGKPAKKGKGRKYPDRKVFLHGQYERLLEESQLLIALQHNNLTVSDLSELRTKIAAIPMPEADAADASAKSRPAKLTIIRSGIMQRVCRISKVNDIRKMEPAFSGPVALLSCNSLSPQYLEALFNVVDRAFGHKPSPKPALGQPFPLVENRANPRLVPLAALLEKNRLLQIPAARDVSRLPSLQTLRAQIIGIISAPGQRLAATLQQAAGVDLALTLEARKRDLEGQDGASSTSA